VFNATFVPYVVDDSCCTMKSIECSILEMTAIFGFNRPNLSASGLMFHSTGDETLHMVPGLYVLLQIAFLPARIGPHVD
jgi:hypothetical protein